jgi:hypothetical protein
VGSDGSSGVIDPSPKKVQDWCDNMRAKYLVLNPIFHGRMKHKEVYYHFVRDHVIKKLLDIRFISIDDQVANGFTKALPQRKLLEFQHNLN